MTLFARAISSGIHPRVLWVTRHFDRDIARELAEWKNLRLLFRRLNRHAADWKRAA